MAKNQLINHARRVLKNYRNFEKLSNLDGAFAQRGKEIIIEIDSTIKGLSTVHQIILVNLFYEKSTTRKSRSQICKELQITTKEYTETMNTALLEFAKAYRHGALGGLEN